MFEIIPQTINEDGSLKHIRKEGARYHILYWNSNGSHCSEPNCEINKRSKNENHK